MTCEQCGGPGPVGTVASYGDVCEPCGQAILASDKPRPEYEYASSETAYGRTVGYPFALKVF